MNHQRFNSFKTQRIKPDLFYSSLIYFFAVIFVLVFTIKSLYIQDIFGTSAYDLGIFDQNLWLLSQFEPAFNTVRGIHGLGDHFRPIEFIFIPLYNLYPSVFWLFLLQTISVAAAGLILFHLSLKLLKGNFFLAFSLTISFFLNPTVHNTLLWQYHGFVLTSGLSMALIYFYLQKNLNKFIITLSLLLLCREDVGFIIIGFGILALTHKRWSYSFVSISLSTLWLIFVFKWVMPYFNGEGYFRHQSGPLNTLAMHVFDWQYYIQRFFFNPEAIHYLNLIFYPLMYLPLLSFRYLIPAIPVILVNTLIGGYYSQINYHYLAMTMPFIYVATAFGFARLSTIIQSKKLSNAITTIFSSGIIALTLYSFNHNSVLNLTRSSNELSEWQAKETIRKDIASFKKNIHQDTGISASDYILPHLSHRKHIYLFPNPWKVHYWGMSGENPHHPNNVDRIVISPDMYKQYFVLLHYLQESNLFKITKETRELVILERLADESRNREEAVANPLVFFEKYSKLSFNNVWISPVFLEQPKDFTRVHINPKKCFTSPSWMQLNNTISNFFTLDFVSLLGTSSIGSIYVCSDIFVDEAQAAFLLLGSDDGLTIWINGRKKLESLAFRSVKLGDNQIKINLQKGINKLVFRVNNIGGDWRLLAQLTSLKPTIAPKNITNRVNQR